jgi:hypothetical protein
MSEIFNLEIVRGTEFVKSFVYEIVSGRVSTPKSLVGHHMEMQFRRHSSDEVALYDATLTDSTHITITSAVDGEFMIKIPSDVTAQFTFQEAIYDIILVNDATTERTRLVRGDVIINDWITRE